MPEFTFRENNSSNDFPLWYLALQIRVLELLPRPGSKPGSINPAEWAYWESESNTEELEEGLRKLLVEGPSKSLQRESFFLRLKNRKPTATDNCWNRLSALLLGKEFAYNIFTGEEIIIPAGEEITREKIALIMACKKVDTNASAPASLLFVEINKILDQYSEEADIENQSHAEKA